MRIHWQKFLDPIAEMAKFEHDESEDEGWGVEKEEILSEYEDDESNKYKRPKAYVGPFINTQFGILPTSHRSLASDKYSMWIGRVTEDLTSTHINALSKCYGVEILMPITRYSFLMGTGPQFDNKKIRKGVEDALSNKNSSSPQNRLDIMKGEAIITYKSWAIVKNHEEHLEIVGGKTPEEVSGRIRNFGELWRVVASSS